MQVYTTSKSIKLEDSVTVTQNIEIVQDLRMLPADSDGDGITDSVEIEGTLTEPSQIELLLLITDSKGAQYVKRVVPEVLGTYVTGEVYVSESEDEYRVVAFVLLNNTIIDEKRAIVDLGFEIGTPTIYNIDDFKQDVDNDGYEDLNIRVTLHIDSPGNYTLDSYIFDDRNVVLGVERVLDYFNAGFNNITVSYSGSVLTRSNNITAVVCVYDQNLTLLSCSNYDVKSKSFDSPFSLYSISDYAEDADADGMLDRITFEMLINSFRPGNYTIEVELELVGNQTKIFSENTTYIGQGMNTVRVHLDSSKIEGLNGTVSFTIAAIKIYEGQELIGLLYSDYVTQSYNTELFEKAYELPDLTIEAKNAGGDTYQITISNVGNYPAINFTVCVEENGEKEYFPVAWLDSNESLTFELTINGSVVIYADYFDSVVELNEDNNSVYLTSSGTQESTVDGVDDALEQLVTKYYPAFDWTADTPTKQDVVQAVINAVQLYFDPRTDPTEQQKILDDIIQLIQLYFQLQV